MVGRRQGRRERANSRKLLARLRYQGGASVASSAARRHRLCPVKPTLSAGKMRWRRTAFGATTRFPDETLTRWTRTLAAAAALLAAAAAAADAPGHARVVSDT